MMPKKVDRSKHKVKKQTMISSGTVFVGGLLYFTKVSTTSYAPVGLPTAVSPPAADEDIGVYRERFDVYNNPEKFGLEPVAQIDYSNGDYCFDYRIVWKHVKTELFYTARDGGCSCPSPFEEYTSLKKLERFSLSEIEEEVLEERTADHYHGGNPAPFLEAVRALVPKTYPQGPRRLLSLEG